MIVAHKKKDLSHLITSINLPSPPQVLAQLIKACREDDPNPTELAHIISKDPAISAKVLKIANSSYFGLANRVTDISQAVVFLGYEAIRNVALSSSVIQAFKHSKKKVQFNMPHFWWHSLLCATISREIALRKEYADKSAAFLAGLLHDIGKLLYLINRKKEYLNILNEVGNDVDRLCAKEKEMGACHSGLGAWLVSHWHISTLIEDAIYYHHHPIDRIFESFALVKIIYVANLLSQYEAEDFQQGPYAAEAILGLNRQEVAHIVQKAEKEVEELADGLGLKIEDKTASKPTSRKDQPPNPELLLEIRDTGHLHGTLENLLKAKTQDAVLQVAERGLLMLFNIKRALFFLYDQEQDALISKIAQNDVCPGLPNDYVIPCTRKNSLIVSALTQKKITDSFGLFKSHPNTILDEEIINLCGNNGFLCLPLFIHDIPIGITVLVLDASGIQSVAKQTKLLKMFAGHISNCLHIECLRKKQTKKVIQERMEAVTISARQITHEVNNPLSIIKNYLKILDRKLTDANSIQDELEVVNSEIDRITKIVGKLSKFSEPFLSQPEQFDLNELIINMMKIIRRSLLAPYKIKDHLYLDPNLPPIKTDFNGLKQVLLNLIKNAAEAMPDGGNLQIKTCRGNNGISNDTVKISIIDDGPGIPEVIQKNIFEPYQTTKGKKHSGLGLAISYNLIKELKGKITFTDGPMQGAEFSIILPLDYDSP
jgi:HD-like signal output (HDOD) protein/signal transduction histidine kinase